MKLPPAALTAPSNCPRCDAPALYQDHCSSCGLQLAQCGACRGIAGPFDRYCGFCGHDLAAGELRSPVWRFWLLVAMIPMVGALILLTIFGGPAVSKVSQFVLRPAAEASPVPAQGAVRALRSQNLHLDYAVPRDWVGYDYSLDRSAPLPIVVVSRLSADGISFGDTRGDILAAKPTGVLMTLGTLSDSRAATDAHDPATALTSDAANFAARPPSGLRIDLLRRISGFLANGRAGREAVFKVTRLDGTTLIFERAYISGRDSLFRVDALVPQSDWDAGDDRRVEAVIQSVKLTG